MGSSEMWVDVRLVVAVLAAVTVGGCGLVLDTSPPPDPLPDGGASCFFDSDCSRDACGGFERCNGGVCEVVIPPLDCDDGLPCTVDECVADACRHVPDDGACTMGKVCIPAEGGCVDPRDCTDPAECDDGNACTAALDCVDGKCAVVAGSTDVVCPAADGCALIGCNPDNGACQVMDLDPSRCAAFEDRFECTTTQCLAGGACVDEPSPTFCDSLGAVDCVVPTCDPSSNLAAPGTGCVFVPNDDYCAATDPVSGCAESICAGEQAGTSDGCVNQLVPLVCGSADQVCNIDSGACEGVVPGMCAEDGDCDDGDPCNGLETCEPGSGLCQAGAPLCQGDPGDCTRMVCLADRFSPGDPTSACVIVQTEACFGVLAP